MTSYFTTRNLVHRGIARGCELCLRGLKSVLFITGLCTVKCFYCPINPERRDRDLMYINDIPVRTVNDILREVERCLSLGLAITGGEPLLVIDRVLEITTLLKNLLSDIHVHLYTNVAVFNKRRVNTLVYTPVDEVRLHTLDLKVLHDKLALVKTLRKASFNVGLEVPVIPGWEDTIIKIVETLYYNDVVEFVNLNEVDVSVGNQDVFLKLGYKLNPDGTLRGSAEACRQVFTRLRECFPDLKIHVCFSKTKDVVQIGLRYFLKSCTMSTVYMMIESDGTCVKVRKGDRWVYPTVERGVTYRYIPRSDNFDLVEIV